MRFRLASLCAVGALALSATSAFAATATGTFNSQITITAQCKVQSTTGLNFPSAGILDGSTVIQSTATLNVQCSNGQGYSIALDGGLNGNTTTRKMKLGSETVSYTLSQDAAHTQNWGNTTGAGSDVKSGLTGNGVIQAYTVYGLVPAQTTTPTAGTYQDTVTVTVTYP